MSSSSSADKSEPVLRLDNIPCTQCGKYVAARTSHSLRNPGRLYFRHSSCDKSFIWHDDVAELIRGRKRQRFATELDIVDSKDKVNVNGNGNNNGNGSNHGHTFGPVFRNWLAQKRPCKSLMTRQLQTQLVEKRVDMARPWTRFHLCLKLILPYLSAASAIRLGRSNSIVYSILLTSYNRLDAATTLYWKAAMRAVWAQCNDPDAERDRLRWAPALASNQWDVCLVEQYVKAWRAERHKSCVHELASVLLSKHVPGFHGAVWGVAHCCTISVSIDRYGTVSAFHHRSFLGHIKLRSPVVQLQNRERVRLEGESYKQWEQLVSLLDDPMTGQSLVKPLDSILVCAGNASY